MEHATQTAPRTNDQWLADLRAAGTQQDDALTELRAYLRRGLFAFLRENRSDLARRDSEDLAQLTEDFAQETLIKVLDNLGTFRGESRFTTWAMKIAMRTAVSAMRRAAYKDLSLNELQANGVQLNISAETSVKPAALPDPQLEAERHEVFAVLRKAVETELSEKQRTAFIATNVEGVPIEIVAERMGSNPNALYKVVHDARKKLRNELIERGFTFDRVAPLFEGT